MVYHPCKGNRLLKRALKANRAALKVRTRTDHPVNWAITQHNLALTFVTLADKALSNQQPDEARQYLNESLACFDRALEVFDPVNLPVYFEQAAAGREKVEGLLSHLP